MKNTLRELEKFHGHLGPYVVLGYRMGQIANNTLGKDAFSKKAIVWTGTKPPISCIIDGIQISSGCTLGKGNISIEQEGKPKAVFSDNNGKSIEILLKPDIQKEIDTTVTEENMTNFSKMIFEKSNEDLFEIKNSLDL